MPMRKIRFMHSTHACCSQMPLLHPPPPPPSPHPGNLHPRLSFGRHCGMGTATVRELSTWKRGVGVSRSCSRSSSCVRASSQPPRFSFGWVAISSESAKERNLFAPSIRARSWSSTESSSFMEHPRSARASPPTPSHSPSFLPFAPPNGTRRNASFSYIAQTIVLWSRPKWSSSILEIVLRSNQVDPLLPLLLRLLPDQ